MSGKDGFDYDAIRDSLRDYYGTAMTGPFPMAVMDLAKIDRMSDSELLNTARKNGLDIDRYRTDSDE